MGEQTGSAPPCPRIEPTCPGRLDYRTDPERFVCNVCNRIWGLNDIAILGQRRTA